MFFLFVQPSYNFPKLQHFQHGLLSIIAQLRKAGHHAEFFSLCERSQYEKGFFNPEIDVIGIYTIECMIPEIKLFVDNYKDDHHILLGGPAATIAPEYVTDQLYYDSLCIGEGEHAILEFANKWGTDDFKNMKGFWFDSGAIRNDPRNRLTQDEIRALEPELRDEYLPDIENSYICMGQRVTTVYATRGCAFSCTYCSNSTYNQQGATLRARTPAQVIADIHSTIERAKITSVTFEDDILSFNREWFSELMRRYRERVWIPHRVRFEMTTRVGCMTTEQLREAARAGCYTVRFGVESGSSFIRHYMGRDGIDNSDMIDLAQGILDHDMNLYYCSIIGVPPETPALFDETRALVDNIYNRVPANKKAVVILNSYYPLHGTPLGDHCYEENWVQRPVNGIGAHVDYSLVTPYMTRTYVLQQHRDFRANYTGMIAMSEELANDYS